MNTISQKTGIDWKVMLEKSLGWELDHYLDSMDVNWSGFDKILDKKSKELIAVASMRTNGIRPTQIRKVLGIGGARELYLWNRAQSFVRSNSERLLYKNILGYWNYPPLRFLANLRKTHTYRKIQYKYPWPALSGTTP